MMGVQARGATVHSDARKDLTLFQLVMQRDAERLEREPWLARWLFADNLEARGGRQDMSFLSFEGA